MALRLTYIRTLPTTLPVVWFLYSEEQILFDIFSNPDDGKTRRLVRVCGVPWKRTCGFFLRVLHLALRNMEIDNSFFFCLFFLFFSFFFLMVIVSSITNFKRFALILTGFLFSFGTFQLMSI